MSDKDRRDGACVSATALLSPRASGATPSGEAVASCIMDAGRCGAGGGVGHVEVLRKCDEIERVLIGAWDLTDADEPRTRIRCVRSRSSRLPTKHIRFCPSGHRRARLLLVLVVLRWMDAFAPRLEPPNHNIVSRLVGLPAGIGLSSNATWTVPRRRRLPRSRHGQQPMLLGSALY